MRRKTRQIHVGKVAIGGDAPIAVQSMCTTYTRDIESTVAQIHRLEEVGCELVRVAVPEEVDALALGEIKKRIHIPLIADIHYKHSLALEAIRQGIDCVRINPGNLINGRKSLEQIVAACKERGIAMRVGVNSGSIDALDKSSSPLTAVEAYRRFSERSDYPLHLGITETGTLVTGAVKSAVGLGMLLSQGIGDTIRVSLSAEPEEEVPVAYEILRSLEPCCRHGLCCQWPW